MYKTRIKIFLVLVGLGLLVLVGRMAHLQIILGERFRQQYQQSLRRIVWLPAARGQITDRDGRILAVDLPCMDLCLDYAFLVKDPDWVSRQQRRIRRSLGASAEEAAEVYRQRETRSWALAYELAQAQGVDLPAAVRRTVERVQRIAAAVRRGPSGAPRILEEQQAHPLVQGLDDDRAVYAEAEIQAGRTVGLTVRPSHKRFYPYGEAACHVVGVVSSVTAEDVARRLAPDSADPLEAKRINYEPEDVIGLCGVEKMCEDTLRGRRGYRLLETGGDQPVEIAAEPAEPGADAHLTLDLQLQHDLAERLRQTGHNAAAVVLEVPTGNVLAMVSLPTFDLNAYHAQAAQLFADEANLPLLNRAVGARYPPGSSAKLITAVAALAEGKITPQTTFQCSGHLFADDPDHWRCMGVHGAVDLHRGILKSCNVYFYNLGEAAGPLRLCEWFRRFGLDQPPGTGLPEDRAGMVPTESWLLKTENRRFSAGDARMMAIGQGPLSATPMHMANVAATIARDGRWIPPRLLVDDPRERAARDLPVRPEDIRAVRRGMWAVVNELGATAYKVFHEGLQPLGVEVCGKTGTAQASPQWVDFNHDGRVDPQEIVRHGDMAWFVGFAPADRPAIAFAVLIEYVTEGGGSSNAGPIARQIVRLCKERYLSAP